MLVRVTNCVLASPPCMGMVLHTSSTGPPAVHTTPDSPGLATLAKIRVRNTYVPAVVAVVSRYCRLPAVCLVYPGSLMTHVPYVLNDPLLAVGVDVAGAGGPGGSGSGGTGGSTLLSYTVTV